MKVLIYSGKKEEKPHFIAANQSRHELIWTSAPLNAQTVNHASGYDGIVIFTSDILTRSLVDRLAELGVRHVLTRSAGIDHIDLEAIARKGIEVRNISHYNPHAVAEHTILLALALSRHLVKAVAKSRAYDFSLNELTGTNLFGKTVGIIGLGQIGTAVAGIFNGLGCKVIGYDVDFRQSLANVDQVNLETLFATSDIITLHLPLNMDSHHLVNRQSIQKMKPGVMLINTSRGGLVNTEEVIAALDSGQLGFYGADVYEFESGIFFEDHESDRVRDATLSRLMNHKNALLTPHQGFLTYEALDDIARQSIKCLDAWDRP